MKKNDKLDFIFINQYVYQIQNRLQVSEQKNNNKTNKITESLFSTSWSLRKYYFFLFKKKIKQNNFLFQDVNLLSVPNLNKVQIGLSLHKVDTQHLLLILVMIKLF